MAFPTNSDNSISGDSMSDVINICPTGDVILVIGPSETRLRVHSMFLRAASKVFEVMLGPNWKECQNLSQKRPPEVFLAEDCVAAMTIICNVLHHRNNAIPSRVEGGLLLRIALAVDKYDLDVALQHTMALWMQPLETEGGDHIVFLLAASYIRGDARMFANLSRHAILHCTKSYMIFHKDELLESILPAHVCSTYHLFSTLDVPQQLILSCLAVQLEQRRTVARINLQEHLFEYAIDECYQEFREGECFRRGACDVMSPSKAFSTSIHNFANDIKNIAYLAPVPDCWEWNEPDPLVRQVDEVYNGVGLCLDCARKGNLTECAQDSGKCDGNSWLYR
jgi:hypothetical protein